MFEGSLHRSIVWQSRSRPSKLGNMPGTHVEENRRYWNEDAAAWVAAGERSWSSDPDWGQWGVPEAELGLLPESMEGMDAVELGCGTGYGSAWMWRRGARVVGLDVSENQLATARRLAEEHGAPIQFLHADAEAVPLPDASFDFALSEFGAALWCEPRAWLGEAHRLLRPGGKVVFLTSTPWTVVCSPLDGSSPIGTQLLRPYFGTYRVDWTEVDVDPGGIEFVPTMAEWFRVFSDTGFTVDDYLEIQAPADAEGVPFTVDADWARRWPAEHVWKLSRSS